MTANEAKTVALQKRDLLISAHMNRVLSAISYAAAQGYCSVDTLVEYDVIMQIHRSLEDLGYTVYQRGVPKEGVKALEIIWFKA